MKTVLLNQIADIVMGQSPKSEFYNEDQKGLPFLQGCTTFGAKYPSFDTWTSDWKKEAEPGDILFTVRAPVGDMNIAQEKIAIGRGIAAIRPKNVSLEYLYFLLQYNVKHFISKSNGAVYDSINADTLKGIKLDVYDKRQTQDRIAKTLSAYDDLIENNNKRIKILEQMAQKLYEEWFVRFRFPGYKTSVFVNDVPLGWNKVQLGQIMEFKRGTSYSSKDIESGNAVLLSMNNIKPYGGFIRDYSRMFSGKYKNYQLVHKHDLIMSITDMTQDRRIIGYVGLTPDADKDLVICTHLLKILSEKYSNYFLYGLFNYSGLSRQVAERATGTNVLGLTSDILQKVRTLLPPDVLVKAYVEKVKPIYEAIDYLENLNANLVKQRDLLLPRLMSGKLEIKGTDDA